MKKTLAALFLTGVFLTACGGSSKPAKPSDKLLDSDIFTQATSGGNLARCNDILDKTLKASCEQIINDQIATNAAVSALDKALCKKVSDERYKKECETQVNAKTEDKNTDNDRLSLQQQAYNTKDYSICDKIADANQKDICKFEVISELTPKDPSLCEKIGQPALVSKCKASKN